MEAMAEEVRRHFNQATFGGHPLLGYIFNDEEAIQNFLTLNEEEKLESDDS